VDYSDYDYYDYGDTDIQSSQDGVGGRVPDFITVTHQVPVATRIPVLEFGRTEWRDILSTSPSLEVVAVTALKSTDINNSPVIYANAHTITKQPGVKDVLYDALRATETTSILFTPTLIRGRKTSFSHITPSTIYNVETVSTQIKEPVDQNQLLNSLIQHLLLGGGNPLAANPLAPNPVLNPQAVAVPQPPQTQFVTHTSTYVTTLTEEKSTVLPITLRGRPITTTIVESSTKVVTATEYSTETIVNTLAPAPQGLGLPPIVATAPAGVGLSPQIASLLPALLGANLLGEQQQQALIIKQQQEALLKAQQEALLARQLQEELLRQQQDALNEQLLAKINIEDLSDEELANLDLEDVLEAAVSSSSFSSTAASKVVFPAKNLFDNVAPAPATSSAESPRSSVITIFKSGDRPGEFTSLVSTVFLDSSSSLSSSSSSSSAGAKEKRIRRAAPLSPLAIQITQALEMTPTPTLQWSEDAAFADYAAEANNDVEATLGGPRGPVHIQLDNSADDFVLLSGLVADAETLTFSSSTSVLPTLLFSP